MNTGLPDIKNGSNGAQCLNPAFVHAIAVPDVDMLDKSDKICVVARGDGIVDVINIESELAVIRSKTSAKARKGSSSTSKDGVPAAGTGTLDENARKRLHLDYSVGGHAAAVSCVTFSLFGEKGKLIISGGNDKSVKVWDCSKYDDAVQTGGNSDVLRLNINLSKKVSFHCLFAQYLGFQLLVLLHHSCWNLFISYFPFWQVNWLCTTPTDSENLVVCDTTKVVKVYSVS